MIQYEDTYVVKKFSNQRKFLNEKHFYQQLEGHDVTPQLLGTPPLKSPQMVMGWVIG